MTCGDHHGHPLSLFWDYFSPLYHQATSESDGMQRRWWSSIFYCFRGYCSLPLSSRDNRVRWQVKTIMVICFYCFQDHCSLRCYPETIKSDGMWRPSWSSIFIAFESSRLLLIYLMPFMLFLLTGFIDWASYRSGGEIARTKLVSYLYFPFICNKI